jgi:hypothetical protein
MNKIMYDGIEAVTIEHKKSDSSINIKYNKKAISQIRSSPQMKAQFDNSTIGQFLNGMINDNN